MDLTENGLDSFNLASVGFSSEYSNETISSIKGGTFLKDTLSLKNNSHLRSTICHIHTP
jgi:hypothetical protein